MIVVPSIPPDYEDTEDSHYDQYIDECTLLPMRRGVYTFVKLIHYKKDISRHKISNALKSCIGH